MALSRRTYPYAAAQESAPEGPVPSSPLITRNELSRIRSEAVNALASGITREMLHSPAAADSYVSDDEADAAINGSLEAGVILSTPERYILRKEIRDELFGYGPIEDLINDVSISEIMVNAPDEVYVERSGMLERTGVRFDDNAHIKRIIDRIVAPLGRHIDDSSPMVDARLEDGSRVNAVIPPVALKGPALTIRKFAHVPYTVDSLIKAGSLSEDMAGFLRSAVIGRLNMLISGGTGSGKTTLLNALSSYIPGNERIITIEDAAELRLQQEHVVRMEARPSAMDGTGAVTVRDMVINSLRMRPDRIIVGEVRGRECLDMLQAMNTGHDGSLTTAHANSPRDAVARIETMAMMSGMELPPLAIRQQCVSAFDLIVQTARFRDGTRKITSISELSGMTGDTVSLQEIFSFSGNRFSATGIRPACCSKIEMSGNEVISAWFDPEK